MHGIWCLVGGEGKGGLVAPSFTLELEARDKPVSFLGSVRRTSERKLLVALC